MSALLQATFIQVKGHNLLHLAILKNELELVCSAANLTMPERNAVQMRMREQEKKSWPSASYYLEIKWISFDIEGKIPNCSDYVEVFLTRPWTRTGYRGIMVGYVAYREDGVNECLQGTHRCSTNATCINTDLWYRCTCNSGYTGNGYSCVPAGHDSSSTSKSKTGAAVYIGGAIGCAVFLGIVFICCCKRSHHCSRTSTATETGHSQSATSGTLNAANASANDTRMQKTEQWQQPHSAVVFSEANAPSIILAPFPHYAANTTAITNTVTSPEYPTAIMPNDLISEPPPSYSAVMASNIYSPPQNPNFVYPALN
eukprot:gene15826-7144_t